MLDSVSGFPAWRSELACDANGQLLSFIGYIDSLIADGWNLLGVGAFAHVLERDSVVLKVCRRDPAYVRYMEHVLSSPFNRAHPRIADVVELIGAGEKFHRVVIERLDNFNAHAKRGEVSLEEIRDLAYRIAVAEAAVRGSSEFTAADERILAAMTPDERVALDGIIEIAHRNGFRADLESWNVMMRGAELVFSDPLIIDVTPSVFHAMGLCNPRDAVARIAFVKTT